MPDFIENYLPNGHGGENGERNVNDYSHELSNLLVVLDVKCGLFDEEVGNLEKNDRLDVL